MKTLSPFFPFLILFLFFSIALFEVSRHQALAEDALHSEASVRSGWKVKEKSRDDTRRLMIGSIAPHCTYNECRGCRFKCRAEQVPVDANDPMNTAFRYLCVCHR